MVHEAQAARDTVAPAFAPHLGWDATGAKRVKLPLSFFNTVTEKAQR